MQENLKNAVMDFANGLRKEIMNHKVLYPASLVAWVNSAVAVPSTERVLSVEIVTWQHYGIVVGALVPTLLLLKTSLEVIKLWQEKKDDKK